MRRAIYSPAWATPAIGSSGCESETMCLQNTVTYSPRWNWDGDRIVTETIVPSGRPVVSGRKQYLADVREYVASGQNAVLRRTISRDWANRSDPEIRQYAEYLTANQRIISGRCAQPGSALFGSTTGDLGPGSLTHRVPDITSTIPANLKNRPCCRFRGALPHHHEIAVDEFPKNMTPGDYKIQKLYDAPAYARQFTYRYNIARNHIRQVFSENWSP